MTRGELLASHCTALKGKQYQLEPSAVADLLAQLDGWQLSTHGDALHKRFSFPDFLHALAFVNALGFMAERENHHPDIELGWGKCSVRFSTHDVGGLSMNDFICAAKADDLLD